MIKSKADTDNTASFCAKFPSLLHKTLGSTGLNVSACGFGAYRVDFRVKEHSEALEYAINSGINIIDTSSNYSDGGSEILIGNVLEKIIESGSLKREEIVIISKGGYLQGKNLEAARKMKEDGVGYKEVTEYAENIWHCIHPDFLKDQITFSLERLKAETIDVYLLHNPEYFLDSPLAKEAGLDELRHEYYNRIKKAFLYLEEEMSNGRIGCYGISSNSFVKPAEDPVFTSLQDCVNAAEDISKTSGFKVIEFPMNFLEKGAIINKNQVGETTSLINFASSKKLGILINRPLNAISSIGLTRIADFEVNPEYLKLDETQIIAEIDLLDSMEEDFTRESLPDLHLTGEIKKAVEKFLTAGKLLKENWKNFNSIENFNDIKKQFLIPRVNYAFSALVSSPGITGEMKNMLDKMAKQTNKLIAVMDSIYGLKANVRSKELKLAVDNLADDKTADDAAGIPETGAFPSLTFSQKAVLMLNSIPAVSSVLVGMRQEKYVDDVIGALKAPVLQNPEDKWLKL